VNAPCLRRGSCRICSAPGPEVCADEARWRADEDYFEDKDRVNDEWHERTFGDHPHRPPGTVIAQTGWDRNGRTYREVAPMMEDARG
jgi:hypothetical protein